VVTNATTWPRSKECNVEKVGIRELKARASELVRAVREEGERYEITIRGEVAALLVPADSRRPADPEAIGAWLKDLDALSDEIGRLSPDGLGADEIMRQERGDA
jgi:prevent-host-death family protein